MSFLNTRVTISAVSVDSKWWTRPWNGSSKSLQHLEIASNIQGHIVTSVTLAFEPKPLSPSPAQVLLIIQQSSMFPHNIKGTTVLSSINYQNLCPSLGYPIELCNHKSIGGKPCGIICYCYCLLHKIALNEFWLCDCYL